MGHRAAARGGRMGPPQPLVGCSAALGRTVRRPRLSVRVARGAEAGAPLRPGRAGAAGATMEPGSGPRVRASDCGAEQEKLVAGELFGRCRVASAALVNCAGRASCPACCVVATLHSLLQLRPRPCTTVITEQRPLSSKTLKVLSSSGSYTSEGHSLRNAERTATFRHESFTAHFTF